MYFCPNCNNVFDVTKTTSQFGGYMSENSDSSSSSISSQSAGSDQYEEIIKKILDNTELTDEDIDFVNLNELIKNNSYKRLKIKQKELVFNKIQDMLPNEKKQFLKDNQVKASTEKAYFICNNCGFMKKIADGTLIFSRVSKDKAQSYATSDIQNMIHSDIIPRTRKYICINPECESHKNPNKREAIFFRMNNTFKVKYIIIKM
jgi:hypothetical protein